MNQQELEVIKNILNRMNYALGDLARTIEDDTIKGSILFDVGRIAEDIEQLRSE